MSLWKAVCRVVSMPSERNTIFITSVSKLVKTYGCVFLKVSKILGAVIIACSHYEVHLFALRRKCNCLEMRHFQGC